MRRVLCRLFTHDIDQIVTYRVGGIYPRTMGWCHRCGHWFEIPDGRIGGRVLGIMPRSWWYEDPKWQR